MLRKFFIFAFAVATVLLARSVRSWACAVCLGGSSDSATDGYNASVLFLMSTPYLVVGSIVGALIFTYRRARKRSEMADGDTNVQLTWKQEDSVR